MTTFLVTNMTQLRLMLQRAKPGDVVEHRTGTLRPRIPIIITQGATLHQTSFSTIDSSGDK